MKIISPIIIEILDKAYDRMKGPDITSLSFTNVGKDSGYLCIWHGDKDKNHEENLIRLCSLSLSEDDLKELLKRV